ncbi:carbon-nitrogen hydrolase family protein [Sphingopyxis sp.]|uniref:carbon-nitrogen hydrolase family protein n=1 Tax=Sphingopyxis sp. TaxID=1908224 RepID=UPI003BAA151B
MKIAVAQLNSSDSIDANLALLAENCGVASRGGAAMLFAPEYSLCVSGDPRTLVKARNHELLSALSSMALTNGLWLHAGSVQTEMPDGRCANRSLIFAPDGELAAHYDKIHLFEAALDDGESWREADIYCAGDVLKTVQTPLGLMGLSICYDLRFPDLYHAYGSVAVDAVAVPSAFTATTGAAHWHVLLRARAIETQCFVVAAAQTGTHSDGRQTFGHSLVVDPWGDVLLDMGGEVGVAFCEIDRAAIDRARRQVPSLRNRSEFGLATF